MGWVRAACGYRRRARWVQAEWCRDGGGYAETMGGRVRLNWDDRVEMSTNAHHVLFSEFLAVSGLFDRFVEESPLVYTSNIAPAKRDVLGTAVLGIVDGAKRFWHFDSLTGDGVSAEAFGLSRTMSCDSVRRGLLKMDARAGLAWAFRQNIRCVAPILPENYILDLGAAEVAALYRQRGEGRHAVCVRKGQDARGIQGYRGLSRQGRVCVAVESRGALDGHRALRLPPVLV